MAKTEFSRKATTTRLFLFPPLMFFCSSEQSQDKTHPRGSALMVKVVHKTVTKTFFEIWIIFSHPLSNHLLMLRREFCQLQKQEADQEVKTAIREQDPTLQNKENMKGHKM